MERKKITAWAIHTRSKEGHGFIGIYWWFYDKHSDIPVQCKGCATALFRTRKEAREALKYEKSASYQSFPKSKVVKVSVIIHEAL